MTEHSICTKIFYIFDMGRFNVSGLISYELFIIVGIVMSIVTLFKLIGVYNISLDWFWFLAGIGLSLEGTISLIKQRRFDKKYKIIERDASLEKNIN